MNTNSIVLIVVAVLVALALVGAVAGFAHKFRAERHLLGGAGILDELAADARVAAYHDNNERTSKERTVRVDNDIRAFRNRGRRRESADSRTTADIRAQLREQSSPTD